MCHNHNKIIRHTIVEDSQLISTTWGSLKHAQISADGCPLRLASIKIWPLRPGIEPAPLS